MDVADIIDELDAHGFDDTEEAQKLSAINEAYWDVCGQEPWPFLEKTVTLTFGGTTGIPSNLTGSPTLVDLHAVTSLRNIQLGGWLDYIDFDEFQSGRPVDLITGTPLYFYFEAGMLTVYPIPAASTTLKLQYIATPVELDADDLEAAILIPKQYHRALLVNGALVKLYAMEEDLDIAAGFKAFSDQAMARMREFMWRRQYQRQMIVVPTDYDDLDDN